MTSAPARWVLSGGIGSGKSTVREMLEERGLRTVDADRVGHLVLEDEAKDQVSGRWPEVVVDGQIDRSRLAGIVFDDAAARRELESMTHPHIFGRVVGLLDGYVGTAVVEMPLLTTILNWPRIVVDAADETRVERLLARGMPLDDIERRLASQPDRGAWLASADLVVPNHGSRDELRDAVGELVSHLEKAAS
jgi:dephospho-CoA kinase